MATDYSRELGKIGYPMVAQKADYRHTTGGIVLHRIAQYNAIGSIFPFIGNGATERQIQDIGLSVVIDPKSAAIYMLSYGNHSAVPGVTS